MLECLRCGLCNSIILVVRQYDTPYPSCRLDWVCFRRSMQRYDTIIPLYRRAEVLGKTTSYYMILLRTSKYSVKTISSLPDEKCCVRGISYLREELWPNFHFAAAACAVSTLSWCKHACFVYEYHSYWCVVRQGARLIAFLFSSH